MEELTDLLSILAIILVFLIMVLCVVYFVAKQRENKNKKNSSEESKTTIEGSSTKIAKQYTKKSIYDFMQFDKIEDNMIIQDKGQRFLMILECEGVNYDLMSNIEKTSVESGFVQFLNTLKYPIQLYVQTRTLNISDSLQKYKERLENVKKEVEKKQQEYTSILRSSNYDENKMLIAKKELTRVRNMYEYGQDVINDIQKTSQNKNVLRRKYYIVVPYYSAELVADLLDEEERRAMIFSELYTRAQALSDALLSCEVKSKILDSYELVELMYIAYNRDDADIYGVDKAVKAGFNEIYSTAPDVLEKKMKALDEQIEEDSIRLANEAISEARLEQELKIKKKEERFTQIVQEMAEQLLKENEKFIGKDVTEKAIEKVKENGKGGKKNGEKAKNTTGKAISK